MAEFLSQAEIDTLLDIADDDTSLDNNHTCSILDNLKDVVKGSLENSLSLDINEIDIQERQEYLEKGEYVEIKILFNINGKGIDSSFFMSENLALKMEYLMLGGIGDKKDNIDVEIIDCVSEMICNISGSFSTNLNAHYEDHMGCTKFIWCDAQHIILEENQEVHNLHEISFKMNDELFKFYINFDDHMKTFLNMKIKK
jgi:flagellar motor switch protein FliN/FliY